MKQIKQNGFTLIEILIVTSLTTLLFAAMFGSYFRIREILEEETYSSQQAEQNTLLIENLSNDIRNIYFKPWDQKTFFFSKKEILSGSQIDRLMFTSNSPYSNASTLQTKVFGVTYFGKSDEGSDIITLYRAETIFPELDTEKDKVLGIPIPVLKNITHFELRYTQSSYDTQLLEEWNSVEKGKVPRGIQVQIRWLEKDIEKGQHLNLQPYITLR